MVDINSELKKLFGFDKFKGNQEKIINSLLQGENVFVIMPTGGGKSRSIGVFRNRQQYFLTN